MALITIDGKGARAASLAEVLDDIHERYKAKLGEDLALSPQTPQAQIAGITAAITAEILEAIVEDSNANSVDHAGGVLLTQLGSLLDIPRLLSTHSRVTATLTGVSGTGVPAGSRARTAEGAVFETLNAVVLSPSGVSVDMQAVDPGPVVAEADSLNEIVTVIAGWESVTNSADAALGIQGQSDQDYRLTYQARTGRLSAGAESSVRAAVEEAGGKKQRIVENKTNATVVTQEWPVFGHSIVVVAEAGSNNDIQRAVDLRRGQGVGTMAAIFGSAPNESNVEAISAGQITWDGATSAAFDLRPAAAATNAARAEALTTAIADAASPSPIPVTVRYLDGVFVAFYAWRPGSQPVFGDISTNTHAAALGLLPATATPAPGPFARARARELTVSVTINRRSGFPGDGLNRMRQAVTEVVTGYDIGEEVWENDILTAIESVPGTRIASGTLSVQYDGNAISGVAVPLDIIWTLPAANLEITIT